MLRNIYLDLKGYYAKSTRKERKHIRNAHFLLYVNLTCWLMRHHNCHLATSLAVSHFLVSTHFSLGMSKLSTSLFYNNPRTYLIRVFMKVRT